MRTNYQQHGYHAQISRDGTCVVHRVAELPNKQVLSSHVGEKHPSQDWREVRLMGCPDEIRVKIVQAWKDSAKAATLADRLG